MLRANFFEEKRITRRARTFGFAVAAIMAAVLFCFLLTARPAHAKTFEVDSTADTDTRACTTAPSDCTLRGAINAANATTGKDTIKFNIPTSDFGFGAFTPGVFTIASVSAMPQITAPLTIDGYSQPGASPNTLAVGNDAVLKIELSGTGGSGTSGLWIRAAKSTVKGLVINGWEEGVRIDGSASRGNKVEGNFIGTDPTGTRSGPTGGSSFGVTIQAPANTIGGTKAAARNIISNNMSSGVAIGGAAATANQVMGNYIGTDNGGDDDLGNFVNGVFVHGGASNNIIGGKKAGARNIISGNDQNGVFIHGSSTTANQVMGNYIGTDNDGDDDLGNSSDGVNIAGARNNTIGGTKPTMRNIISGNGDEGVEISGSGATSNSVLSNSISANTSLGIDLIGGTENASVTANDTEDLDTGPNSLQNFPVLSSATSSGKKTTIEGTLNSTANTKFIIQFFSSPGVDLSGHGEGQKFLGQQSVTTDDSGNASFTATTPAVPAGEVVTATATDQSTGDTSEFSQVRDVL